MSVYSAQFDGENHNFNNASDFLKLVLDLLRKGIAFTIKVAKAHLPQIAEEINAFLSQANIRVTIESGSDPKIGQILSHGIAGGTIGGTIGSLGGAYIGQIILKKAAEKALKRTILLAVPGTQVLLPALAVYDIISIGSIIAGGVLGGTIGTSGAVAICYWKVTISISNNAQNGEMKFQPKIS
jgi:hypothetical protein